MGGWIGLDFSQPITLTSLSYNSVTSSLALVSKLIGQCACAAKILDTKAKEEKFDLIAIGSRGLGNTASMLLGSVSRQVVSNAQCNVLVVKSQ